MKQKFIKIIIFVLFSAIFGNCLQFPMRAEHAFAASDEFLGSRRLIWENFDTLSLAQTLQQSASGSVIISDKLKFGQYYYDSIKTENGALHLSRTGSAEDTFTSKFATIYYNGEGVDSSYTGRLGRSLRLTYEIDITPMQTNVAFSPLTIAHNTSASGTTEFMKFDNRGQILFLKENIGTYTAGKRYRLRIEFDLQDGIASCFINGEKKVSEKSFTVLEGFQSANIYSLRTSFEAAKGINSDFYVDNIHLEQYIRQPSTEVITVEKDGQYPTIASGIAAVRTTGGTVLIKAGTYEEDVTVSISGDDYDRLKIIGEDGAVIVGKVTVKNAVNVSLQNLTLEGGALPLYTQEELDYININRDTLSTEEIADFRNRETEYKKDAITIQGNHCEVLGCTVQNYIGTAINLLSSGAYVAGNYLYNCAGFVNTASDCIIENNDFKQVNVFYSNGGAGDVFRVFGTNVTIRNNYYHGTKQQYLYRPLPGSKGDYYAHADFFQSYDNTKQESGYVLIENNRFTGFCHQGFMLENDSYASSTGVYYVHDWTVRNNIFTGFTSWGVCAGKTNGGIPNMVFYNNIFDAEKAYYGIAMNGIGSSGIVYNNVLIGKGITALGNTEIVSKNNVFIDAPLKGAVTDSNSIVLSDPAEAGFTSYIKGNSDNDEQRNDFHLTENSPLIDKGIGTDAKIDFDGCVRSIGIATDIGPYEYGTQSYHSAKITAPKNGYSLKLGNTLNITTEDSAVQLYADSLLIGNTWKPERAGIYTLRSISVQDSDEITVIVYPDTSSETMAVGSDVEGKLKVSVFEKTKPFRVLAAYCRDNAITNILSEAVAPDGADKVYTLSLPAESSEIRLFVWNDALAPLGKKTTVRRNEP